MAIVLVFKLPFLDFKLWGSMERNEFRIDRCETQRGQVSCSDCRESSRLQVERREDNFLLVFYTGSPLRSHKHAQITHRHTKCLQVSVLSGDLRFVWHKKAESWDDGGLTVLLLKPRKQHPGGVCCPDMCVMNRPNAHQDIAVTQLKIFLPSASLLLWSYDRNDAALFFRL